MARLAQPYPVGAPGRQVLATTAAMAAMGITTLAVLGTAVAVEVRDPGVAAERWLPMWVGVPAMLTLLFAGLVPWWIRSAQPRAAIGLAVAVVCAVLPIWAGWSWLPAELRSAVLAVAYLVVAGLAQVGLAWEPHSAARAIRVVWFLAGFATVTHILVYNPFEDPWCSRVCLDVAVPLDEIVSVPTVQLVCGTAAVAAGIMALAGLRAVSPRTAVTRSLMWAIAAVTVLTVAVTWGPPLSVGPVGLAVVLAPLPVTAVAGIVGLTEFRQRQTRAAIRTLIEDLSSGDAPGPATEAARSVSYALPEGGWVDSRGLPAESDSAGRMLVLADSSGPMLRVAVRGAAPEETLAQLTPGRRLALVNSRLTALARAQVLQQQHAQRETVSRADSERHRIERDLHDGAQQHLVSAAFHLELVRLRSGAGDHRRIEAWSEELGGALGRLRQISHGLFPGVLDEEGLEAALSDLVRDLAGPAVLEVSCQTHPDPEVARAAYAAVESSLRCAEPEIGSDSPHIRVVGGDGMLVVTIRITGRASRLDQDQLVADRVGSLGGSYSTRPVGAHVVVEARIPCVS